MKQRTLEEILEYSPHKELRDIQLSAIETSYKYLTETDKKFIVLELPAGVGKSAVGWILSHVYNDSYFITIQKLLQDQYASEMGDNLVVVKGKGTYTCKFHSEYTCENSICSAGVGGYSIRKAHVGDCPYQIVVNEALESPNVLFNMHSFYYQTNYGRFGSAVRDLLIVDEGHLIENGFLSIIETKVYEEDCGGIDFPHKGIDTLDHTEFINKVVVYLSGELADMERLDDQDVDSKIIKRMSKISNKINKLAIVLSDMKKGKEWVHLFSEDKRGNSYIAYKPLYVDYFIKDKLYSYGDKVLIMSATIGSFKQFCYRNGIDVDDAVIIRGPSPFPIENRPILYDGVGSMGRKKFSDTFPLMVNKILELLGNHKGERGIIHTHSEWLARKIIDAVDSSRLTTKEGGVYNMLKIHEEKEDSVIVAAGVSTGLDLKDELSRFQLIVKMPYPDLGDPQMKRRFEISKEYYNYVTALTLMQTYGRSVRSVDDRAVTYILDSDFGRFKHFSSNMLSNWFLEAITKC